MSARLREEIEEGEDVVILIDLVARQLATDHAGEDVIRT
jgi:hypothetical protein